MVGNSCVENQRDGPIILHVDDDADIRDVVRMALNHVGGLEVVQFSSGSETVENADRIDVDLFLLDVMMPGLSGPETLKQLRSFPRFASIPAVFLTAKATEDGLDDLWKLGAASVITKPFDPMTLADTLIRIWRQCPAR